jgi:prepilin-type N-terminal cleavage/methylation domain-containing protein
MKAMSGFSLLEILAALAIMSLIAIVASQYVANYVSTARSASEARVLSELNQALNSYRVMNTGASSFFTVGTPASSALNRLRTGFTSQGRLQQFFSSSFTVPSRSLDATGIGSRYRFTRYSSVRDSGSILNGAVVSTWAGTGVAGSSNAFRLNATFGNMAALAWGPDSYLYVNGQYGGLRRIAPDGMVSNFGTSVSSSVGTPAFDSSGNLYIPNHVGKVVYRVTPSNVTSVYAGILNSSGTNDGTLTTARFQNPEGLYIHTDGTMYITDSGAHHIRRIDTSGNVTTFASTLMWGPQYITCIPSQNALIVNNANLARITRIDMTTGATSVFLALTGSQRAGQIAVDEAAGRVYFAMNDNRVYYTSLTGTGLTVFAGTGTNGWVDGPAASANFSIPAGIAMGPDGNLYVAHGWGSSAHVIRRISPQ